MNGAEVMVSTMVAAGMGPCFANPGTTELHLVAALDAVPGSRAVLGTFEGVCTGAADGYGRMADRPAWTLLHLGPGLANGAANLHNARRARTPLVSVVGDHATWHRIADAPLTTDLAGLAAPVSDQVIQTGTAGAVAKDLVKAASAAARGQVVTLLVPADHSWGPSEAAGLDTVPDVTLRRDRPGTETVEQAAAAVRAAQRPLLLLGGTGCRAGGLRAAAATGVELLVETFPARWERGGDLPAPGKLQYVRELAGDQLARHDLVLLAGARPPVSFFGYPGRPSALTAEHQQVRTLAGPDEDAAAALADLAAALAADGTGAGSAAERRHAAPRPQRPTGALDLSTLGAAVAESNTSGVAYNQAAAGAAPHTTLSLTGGAIGFGPPAATGAAVACPDRPVINLQADGSALYTLQALWTQAREGLDVTTVICANDSYRILRYELGRLGAQDGRAAIGLTDLGHPATDWVALAAGFGVPGRRAGTADELTEALAVALSEPGPHLVEARL
jgi:acetolactate synthase-1/2/3 large subunit